MKISENALIKRINRRLDEFERVRKPRGQRWDAELGDHFIVDMSTNVITTAHVDLNKLADDLGIRAHC